ncbi:MAG: L,D-transpeptidase family protein [Eubacterium sp.]|nr:L,D-transpeptidase family protein [Eubacterium sp.]
MRENSRNVRIIFAVLALMTLIVAFVPKIDVAAAGSHGSGTWKTNPQGKWYEYEDGYYPKDKWSKIDGGWYFFDKSGYLKTGWIKYHNKWYYTTSAGKRLTGWRMINGKKYFFDKKGVMKTGWKQTPRGWYYFGEDGALVRGEWITENGKRYYLKKTGLLHKRGWFKYQKEWYFIRKDGSAKTGWFKEKKKYYYFYNDGRMARSAWISSGGYWYYLLPNGEMATGVHVIDGQRYDFGKSGGISDPMLLKAQEYSSSTNFLILVNRTDHKVGIFTGSQNKWTSVKTFPCTDGVNTPNGVFTIGEHIYHFGEDHGYTCWYASQISGNFLFHSVLYYPGSMENIMDGRIGVTASQGCIRLDINNAKWIYENIPSGTKVVMYQ